MSIEQRDLRQSARRLLESRSAASPEAAWQAIVAAGWTALTGPESLGGLDQPLAAACWIYTEMGRALSPVPLLPSLLAVAALSACPVSPARDVWIERIAGGEPIAMSLLDGRQAGAGDAAASAVLGAARAEHALLFLGAEPSLAIVRLRQPGVEIMARPTWDRSRALSDLRFAGGLPGEAEIVAEGKAALMAADAVTTHLHFAIAADCLGAADAILEQTVTHLKTRRQFDRPLALFQALKHRCADLKTAVAAAEALVADYTQAIEYDRRAEQQILARGAKAIASTTFRNVAEEAIQLHGGMGMTEEHPCHFFLKRALLNEQLASPDDSCAIAVGSALSATLQA